MAELPCREEAQVMSEPEEGPEAFKAAVRGLEEGKPPPAPGGVGPDEVQEELDRLPLQALGEGVAEVLGPAGRVR